MRLLYFGLATSVMLLVAGIYTTQVAVLNTPASAEAPQVIPSRFHSKPELPDINQIFDTINTERTTRGLQPLSRNTELTKIASERAADMASKHYYAHKNPEGLYFYDLLKQENISTAYACENLDLESTLEPNTYVTDWLTSTRGHRECMLHKNITHAGFAATPFSPPGTGQLDTPMYIVVTIYAQPPATIAQK